MRSTLAALLATLLVTQAGCSPDSSDLEADGCVRGDDPRTAAQTVLDRRTAAVEDDDAEAFLATVDAGDDDLQAEQQAWFTRVQQLPEHTLDLTLSVNQSTSETELTTHVNQEVQLAGIDEKPVGADHLMTFGQRDGCWLVVADEPDKLQVAMAPWDAAGSLVVHRDGVLLVTDETDEDERDRILDEAGAAWRATRDLVGSGHHRADDAGVVVMAFTTEAAMKANGVYHQRLEVTGGLTLPVQAGSDEVDFRVLLAPSELEDDEASYLPKLLRHEFVHVLLARFPSAPLWATEGVAEYYASGMAGGPKAPLSDVAPSEARTDGVGLLDEDFYAGDWETVIGHYAVAWAAMTYLGREHGREEPARLVRVLDKVEAYYYPEKVDRVLQERYGLTSDELAAAARELIAELQSE